MEGPSEAKMSCTDNKDGSCSVEYIPYEPGKYNLNVTYGGQPIKGTWLLQMEKIISIRKHFYIVFMMFNIFYVVFYKELQSELVSSALIWLHFITN